MSSTHRSPRHQYPRMPFHPYVRQYQPATADFSHQQQAYRGSLVHPRPTYASDAQRAVRLALSSPTAISLQKPSSSSEQRHRADGSSSESDRTRSSTSLSRSGAISRGKEQPRRRRRDDPSLSRATAAVHLSRAPVPPRVPSTHGLKPSAKYPGYYEESDPSASPGLFYNPSSYTDFQYQSSRPMRDSTNVLPRYHGTGGPKSIQTSISTSRKTMEESSQSRDKSSRSNREYDSLTGRWRSRAPDMETIPLSPLRRMVPPPRPHPMPGFGNTDEKFQHGFLWTTKYNPASGRTEVAVIPAPPPKPHTRPARMRSWMRSCVGPRY